MEGRVRRGSSRAESNGGAEGGCCEEKCRRVEGGPAREMAGRVLGKNDGIVAFRSRLEMSVAGDSVM